MKLPSTTAIVLNGAAMLIAGASLVVVVRSVVIAEEVAPCKDRFQQASRLSLDRNGVAMSLGDLQGQLGNTDWGLMSGGRVVKLKSGPAPFALELDLATAPSAKRVGSSGANVDETREDRAGIGFTWAPQSFSKPIAACLSYSVFLPDGFSFGRGGRLPGFLGTSSLDSEAKEPAFSTRLQWGVNGDTEVQADVPGFPEGKTFSRDRAGFKLERGRWIELEQELVLNAPGRNDGVIRVWRDGKLVLEKKDMPFRVKPSVMMAGVLAEAVAGEPMPGQSAGPQKIWLTPFELRWQ